MSLYPSYLLVSSKRYRQEQQPVMPPPAPRFRVVWDDESPDWNNKCRTQHPDFAFDTQAPPAVYRFAPQPLPAAQDIGLYKVDISAWKQFFLGLNGGSLQAFDYWSAPGRAQFNHTGWPMLMYVVMSGNRLKALRRYGDWLQFETLKPTDLARAAGWTRATHPEFIHTFTCVSFKDGETRRIMSTGTPRGVVDYPLISREGYGWIKAHNVIEE